MKIRQLAGTIIGALLATLAVAPLSRAQEMNEGTKVTFQEAVRIPGHVLQPGTYFFERAHGGNGPNLNLIQIYNDDHSRLIATIETVTAQRQFATGGTVMAFAKRSNGRPPALLEWFYPGMRDGHEFVYRPDREQELEASKADFVLAHSKGSRLAADDSGD